MPPTEMKQLDTIHGPYNARCCDLWLVTWMAAERPCTWSLNLTMDRIPFARQPSKHSGETLVRCFGHSWNITSRRTLDRLQTCEICLQDTQRWRHSLKTLFEDTLVVRRTCNLQNILVRHPVRHELKPLLQEAPARHCSKTLKRGLLKLLTQTL